jgi:tetratricopeptide (TPR) repeat protein
MKLRRDLLLLFVSLTFLHCFCFAQDYRMEFNTAFQNGDTVKQKEALAKWQKADGRNAELFTSYFNYYFQKSRREIVSLTQAQPRGESLEFHDSTGNAGYLGSEITFDPEVLQLAFDKIDEGIKLYPDRLDMRFGKIYVLGEVEEWQRFTDEIIKTIRYSITNKNKWTWTNNVKKENGEDFFFSGLQDYQVKLFNTQDDNLIPNIRSVAEEVLKIKPDHVESLSNLGVTYLITQKYDEALVAFLRAEKNAPKDMIVVGNIAHAYKLKGNKQKAIEYYEKVISAGDTKMSDYAKKQIKELQQ